MQNDVAAPLDDDLSICLQRGCDPSNIYQGSILACNNSSCHVHARGKPEPGCRSINKFKCFN